MTNKITTSGKRKKCVARATIEEGTGKVSINNKSYTSLPMLRRLLIEEPLRIAKEKLGHLNYNISVSIRGGGQECGI